MFAKVLVLVVSVVAASCHDHPHAYHLRNVVHHQQQKEYKPYEHHIRVQPEPSSSEEYKLPESHGQAYSSQSIHHGLAAYQESHESNEHVAPVYQYVEDHEQAHHEAPAKPKYHTAQYALPGHQEIKSVRVPVHHKPHVHFQPESHEVRYHHPIIEHAAPVHHAVPVHHSAPVHHASAHHEESHESHDEPIDYYAYPKYQYEYKVEDPHTGDNKFQHETRDGDVVKGVYGLHEADGSIRTVEYSSDKHNGFTAVVKHTAPGQHVQIETHHQN